VHLAVHSPTQVQQSSFTSSLSHTINATTQSASSGAAKGNASRICVSCLGTGSFVELYCGMMNRSWFRTDGTLSVVHSIPPIISKSSTVSKNCGMRYPGLMISMSPGRISTAWKRSTGGFQPGPSSPKSLASCLPNGRLSTNQSLTPETAGTYVPLSTSMW
jgi:hypothetical protein